MRKSLGMRTLASQLASLVALAFVIVSGALLLESEARPRPPDGAPALTGSLRLDATSDAPTLPETRDQPSPSASATAPPAISTPRPLDVDGLRIVVPRLGIDLPLQIGDPERDAPRPGFAGATPENVALVYPGSANPGDQGNTYVYAHARNGMFLTLWNARLGDTIVVRTNAGAIVREYSVAAIIPRVDPSDAHWLDVKGVERITLQTSTGPRPEDPRFIVVAYPAASQPPPRP